MEIPTRIAFWDKEFETIEKLKICHNILVFLRAIEFKQVISKTKIWISVSSRMFSSWARKIYDNNLITENDQIDQQSIEREQESIMKIWILNASSEDGFRQVIIPSDSLLTLISKKSHAKVLTHLYFMMNNEVVFIIQGLATSLYVKWYY